ncbi:MAG: hypothetical protein ACTS8Y_04565, partial [Arsenophonus sp. ER-EMS1-MAG3]
MGSVLLYYTTRLGFDSRRGEKISGFYTAALPSQGNGKPASGTLPSNTSLFSRSEPALNCRPDIPVR